LRMREDACVKYPVFACICPQQTWLSGKTTSCPSLSRMATVACGACGNIESAMQVAKSAMRTDGPFVDVIGRCWPPLAQASP
jgi:hypothetical protein